MIKNPDTDTKITALPAPESTMPALSIQTAANFLAGCQRLAELANVPNYQPEHDKEAASIRAELGAFISQHAVSLVTGWLNCAAILQPLQTSLAAIIGPAVARALKEDRESVKS